MDGLRIRWSGGESSFQPGKVVRIGRDPGNDVTLKNANVSRHHAEVTHGADGWVLHDRGSAQGTWRDGRQVDSVPIRGTVSLTVGREDRGEVLVLEASASPGGPESGPTEVRDLPAGRVPSGATEVVGAAPGAGSPDTMVVGRDGGRSRPGGPLREEGGAPGTVLGGGSVTVEVGGRTSSFEPGRDVVIGRDEDCDVRCEQPSVSRRHAVLTHDDSGWTLLDDGSSGGTHVRGRKVTREPVRGRLEATLGDPRAGERIVITTGDDPGRSRTAGSLSGILTGRAAPVLLAVGAVVAIVLAGVLLVRTLGGGGASEDVLARATVGLQAGDRWGSGTIVDAEQGLILTNAHVVAPSATGTAVRRNIFGRLLDANPKEVVVHVASGPDKEIEPRYVGKVVAMDGYLDLAVVKITETVGGRIIEPESGDLDELVEVEIAEEGEVGTGEALRVFGFPDAAQSSSVTLTEGVVSGPVKDDRLATNRAMLNIDADVRSGNSGGLAASSDGVLVGVPSIIRDDEVPSMRPARFAVPLIERARAGKPYRSPWLRPVRSESIGDVTLVAGGQPGTTFTCGGGRANPADGTIGVSFDYSGFRAGRHQDLMVELWAGQQPIGFWALDFEYPVEWPASEGCATVSVPVDSVPTGVPLRIAIGIGPDYEPA